MSSAKIKKRKDFVDIAKGITILLVVMEHNAYIYKYHTAIQVVILSFHMPLFYFVSGLFFSSQEKLGVLTKKRFHSLVKPYLASCLLFFLLKSVKDFQVDGVVNFLVGVLYGTGESLNWPYQQLWFLTSLFMTVLACRVLYIALNRVDSSVVRLFLLVLLLGISVYVMKHMFSLPFGGLPWNIDLLGITVFFYALGVEMRSWLFSIEKVPCRWFFVVLLIFCTLHYCFTISVSDPHALNLYLRKYDHFIVNSLEAIAGIFLVIFVSIGLATYSSTVAKWCSYVGCRSLTIFVFHELIMPYSRGYGKIFFAAESFILFTLSILFTVGFSLIIHELIAKTPLVRFLLLNKRISKGYQ